MLHIDENELKLCLQKKKSRIERPKLSGTGEIVSGISLIITLTVADFQQIKLSNPLWIIVLFWIIAVVVLLVGLYSLIINLISFYSVDMLFSEIRELDPNIEHAFNIIVIKNSLESGKMLLFHNRRWKSWHFPDYKCLEGTFNQDAEAIHIKECLLRDIGISNTFELNYLGNIRSQKYSPSDKFDKKYRFHFFELIGEYEAPDKQHSFEFNGNKYCWKTIYQMYSDNSIKKTNIDVLDFVREKVAIS